MKKSTVYKLLILTNFSVLSFPLIGIVTQNENRNIINENQIFKVENNNSFNSKIVEDITITNPDILKSYNFSEVRNLLETPIMTQDILDQLSIEIPASANARLVSFTNINNDLFKIRFTINYDKVSKSTNDFLNITPTDQEIANSIVIENPDILSSKSNTEIKALLEDVPMNQEKLNQLSIKIPDGAEPSKVFFDEINIDNPIRITFKIKYNESLKSSVDYLSSTASDKEVANSIIVENPDALSTMTVMEIRLLLESNPMTYDILNQLSILVPEGINVSRISFKSINISDPFKVTFIINYNNVPKDTTDFLNAILTDKQTVEATVVQDENALSSQNINNIKAYLEESPMTKETLELLSISTPPGSIPSKYSFTNIDVSNPFKIVFTINYNGVPKDTTSFLNATPTDKEVANAINISNDDILLDQNVQFIKNILESPVVVTQEILNKLSIVIPEGAVASSVSFSNIDISNLYRVTFRINYNKVSKDQLVTLNATPTDQEIVDATILENPSILESKNVQFIKNILETPVITQKVLDQLSIKIPIGSTPSKFSFTNINIEDPFVITFVINYNNVPKLSFDYLIATPTDQEIVNSIIITNNESVSSKSVKQIRDILEQNPTTKEILDLLSIQVFSGININRITFTNIDIKNPLKITFTINYNGVSKENDDFLVAFATDLEIANSITIVDINAVSGLTVKEIRDLLETSTMTIEILNQLSISVHEGIDIKKISFTDINIDNLFKITFRIRYNNVSKLGEDFFNATPADQDVANRIIVNNPNILKDKNSNFVKSLLETNPMTQDVLDQLSIEIFEGIDPTKISFSNINIDNPLRVTFNICYNGVAKETIDFLNTTQSDQEIVNVITVSNVDAVKNLTTKEIRDLLETKPLTIEILNKLSIVVPEGAQIFRISFTNINVTDLFRITFTINYNGVANSTTSYLNATPSDKEILNSIEVSNHNILIDESHENIQAMLETNPMTLEILTRLSIINIPIGVDISKISFTNINISNPLRVTFTIKYDQTEKESSSWLNTNATDLEVANVIEISDPDILRIENSTYIKKILEEKQTLETLNKLGIIFPEGADISKISFTDIDISNSSKVVFKINYNGISKSSTDSLNSTPTEDIANAIKIENNDILNSKNGKYIENLMKINPMTQKILDQLSIVLPPNIPAERISFTDIDTSDLFRITFRINYNGVPKDTTDFLNTEPTDQDIANAIIITDFDIFSKKDVHFVETLLKTTPMTKEILDQLSIKLPKNCDPAKVTFTNINIDNLSKITFTINYNGVASVNEAFFNTSVVKRSSETILLISIIIPISSVLIAVIIGFYFWNKKRNDSGKGGSESINQSNNEIQNPETNNKKSRKKLDNQDWYDEQANDQLYQVQNNDELSNNIQQNQQANDQWYDDKVNAEWYNEQANSEWYNNQEYPLEQQNLNNVNINQVNDQNNDEWIDNRWYSNEAETGQWLNGNWKENENQRTNQINNQSANQNSNQNPDKNVEKTKNDNWTSMLEMIEK